MDYHQCHLERIQGPTRLSRTTWLPKPYAVLGATLKLKDGNTWTDGWRVAFVSAASLDDAAVRKAETAHRNQRRASDV